MWSWPLPVGKHGPKEFVIWSWDLFLLLTSFEVTKKKSNSILNHEPLAKHIVLFFFSTLSTYLLSKITPRRHCHLFRRSFKQLLSHFSSRFSLSLTVSLSQPASHYSSSRQSFLQDSSPRPNSGIYFLSGALCPKHNSMLIITNLHTLKMLVIMCFLRRDTHRFYIQLQFCTFLVPLCIFSYSCG